jgi:uncharacterized protein YcfJ
MRGINGNWRRKMTNWKTAVCIAALLITQDALADQYSGAADCEAYAKNEARRQGNVLGGAARGAARGAVLGRIVGRDSKSRRRGAKLGAIAGGARRAKEKDRVYDRAFKRCMQDLSDQRKYENENNDQ